MIKTNNDRERKNGTENKFPWNSNW